MLMLLLLHFGLRNKTKHGKRKLKTCDMDLRRSYALGFTSNVRAVAVIHPMAMLTQLLKQRERRTHGTVTRWSDK
jgi:hypothetical protein